MISRAQIACSIFIYFAMAACGSAQTRSTVPTDEDIVAQMAQAQADNHTHFQPYIVTRDYKLFEGKDPRQARSRITAEIIVVPPESKQYIIDNTDGSGWGEKIVRTMLDGEVAFAKASSSTDITGDNYDFLLVGEDELKGQLCYVLELLPKRKSKDLLRGTIWVDARTYLPQRIEGEPAKSPSWWLKDVRVVLLYGYVGSMWLQTSSKATANVRVLGQSTMVWQDVKYQIGDRASGASLAQSMVSVEEIADDEGRR
ncbi:MAG: outer membrane lipoprotein-sorting protein [Candidatus Acidiferrales bacterium]